MPITASYSAATRRLTALGDAFANSIIFTRDVSGTLFVNGGAVPITGGPATVANTDLIEVFGLDLDDVITLDETNGVLPAAALAGGNGNDTLTGGSNGDTLNGNAGIDTLLGRAGTDQLFGGSENDTLTGGDGNDVMNGEGGNDRMIWNPGDDNDVMEGGTETDIAEVNGGNGAETFTITANGARVRFDRIDATPFVLDIGTTESLVLNANGGNDIISTVGSLAGLIALTIDGGAGDDTITSSNGADVLLGGDGNDFVDGNQGNDVALLGAGDDVFNWDPGDASDVVEGQADADELRFNGSNASENIDISPNGGRVNFFRDVAAVTMDLNDVETITYKALSGSDNVIVNNLSGTDLTNVVIDLAASAGGGDGQADRVTVVGTGGDDVITAAGASILVDGLSTDVLIENEEAIDRLVIVAAAGDDVIDASGIVAGQILLELQGGLGEDVFLGSQGGDLILGQDGNDTALMGAGDDVFVWNPGDDNDTLEGQAGTDTMDFNGNGAIESVSISANGGRILFFRDVAAVTMDLNDVEQIIFDAGGGADTVIVNDLTGTDATQITVNLAGTIGGTTGDAANDTIFADGSAGVDIVDISGATGAISATGLPYTLLVNQSEATDQLVINAGAGADVIDAAALLGGVATLTLQGDAGNDNITGSSGADLLQGGENNDTLTGGTGGDQMLGENGNDRMIWNPGDGTDLMEGGVGSDTAEVNGGNGGEVFTITANGARVRFDRVDAALFSLDIGTTETLVLNANGGNDTISTTGNLAALIALTIDGGAGDDTILGGNGADLLLGGDGNDFIDGQQGNDLALLGAGDDLFQWDPGDGNDVVEGQDGTDTLLFNGNGANEIFTLSANGGRATLQRDIGLILMDVNDVESFTINALGGTDSIVVNDLSGTDATQVTVNLAGTIGGSTGDGLIDSITARATGGDDLINVVGAGAAYFVTGLPGLLSVSQSESTDGLSIQAGGGNDTIFAATMGSGVAAVSLDGGAGNDIIEGSAGGDNLQGGDGNDLVDGNQGGDFAILGVGDDVFEWDPGDGSDVIEGQAGADELRFNGSNASENIDIFANGGRAVLQRDVAAVFMDFDDVETITYNAFGGADNITVFNMAGTDVTRTVINLAASAGGGDGQADTVTIQATTLGDVITVMTTAPGVVTVTGLASVVEIRNFEFADRLVIQTFGGNDVIDASALDVGIAFVVDAGDGDDVVTGGDGADILMLGLGNNSVFASPGGDIVSSAGGHISIFP